MGDLFNVIGLGIGIVLYAMLLVMVVGSTRQPGGQSVDRLLVATALLGLIWNLGALSVYELLKVGMVGPFSLFTAVGFSALGFLPAVVVHSVLRRDAGHVRGRLRQVIIGIAYVASGLAAALHGLAVTQGAPVPSETGMRMLTYVFVALIAPLALVTKGQERARRTLWAAALAIFAVSSLHLSQFHQGEPSLAVELLGHHASLPLALAILYQDFPFALADIFLKRALTLLLIVSTAFATLVTISSQVGATAVPVENAAGLGALLAVWVATVLFYPRVRGLIGWFVDAVLLHRPDYNGLRSTIAQRAAQTDDIHDLLDEVCRLLQPALSASALTWTVQSETAGAPHALSALGPGGGTVEVPVAEHERYQIRVSGLTGGRRLLSDDREFLEAIAQTIGRRIDAIRISEERYARERREQEMAALATQAELRALRSQINPHFLFNALTTIGYLIQTSPPRALDTLMRLTALLRGVLRSEGEFTTLGRELDLIQSYLDIEHARFEERLRVSVRVPPALRELRLPPLLLQPLVENAVKHGIAPERRGGDLLIEARTEAADGATKLVVTVRDTGSGATDADFQRSHDSGVGLRNIRQRLAVQYGAAAALIIRSAPGVGTTATLTLPAQPIESREPATASGAVK